MSALTSAQLDNRHRERTFPHRAGRVKRQRKRCCGRDLNDHRYCPKSTRAFHSCHKIDTEFDMRSSVVKRRYLNKGRCHCKRRYFVINFIETRRQRYPCRFTQHNITSWIHHRLAHRYQRRIVKHGAEVNEGSKDVVGNRPFRTGWSRRTRASRYSGCTRRSGSSLRSSCPGSPGYTWKPLWTCGAWIPSGSYWARDACCSTFALGSLTAGRTGRTRYTLDPRDSCGTAFSLRPLTASRPHRALRADWPLYTLNSLETSWSCSTSRARNPLTSLSPRRARGTR